MPFLCDVITERKIKVRYTKVRKVKKECEKMKIKKWLRPFLFTVGGALVGLGYYYAVGCSTGSCAITSNPIVTMIYMGVIGLLLSGLFGKGCDGKCNM